MRTPALGTTSASYGRRGSVHFGDHNFNRFGSRRRGFGGKERFRFCNVSRLGVLNPTAHANHDEADEEAEGAEKRKDEEGEETFGIGREHEHEEDNGRDDKDEAAHEGDAEDACLALFGEVAYGAYPWTRIRG